VVTEPLHEAVLLGTWLLDHLELHSFPTRRSSDLGAAPVPHPGRPRGARPGAAAGFRGHGVGGAGLHRPGAGKEVTAGAQRFGTRSEEHTSELQSREKIVCRLLLEKKKTRFRCAR